ncbi:MAG TPA: arsenite efflux transporter metallochaperone ArsD [Planctomycetota bacterium]|jgi:hypothetical protein
MPKLEVYDPPMCCSTGVCGPNVNPVLPRFAADLDWLKAQGVAVKRYNLAQQPGAFVQNEIVRKALKEKGQDCLPLILVNGSVVSRAAYPKRAKLASFAEISEAKRPAAKVAARAANSKQRLPVPQSAGKQKSACCCKSSSKSKCCGE